MLTSTLKESDYDLDELFLADQSQTDTVLETHAATQTAALASDPIVIDWIADLCPSSFSRVVDWRWQLAGRLAQGALVPRTWRDKNIVKARDFQLLLAKATDADLECLAAQRHNLFTAHYLYRRGPDLTRYEVQARILAKEPFESISRKTGISAGAIAAYEVIFFDVLSRHKSPGYITHQVIGPKLHYGLKASDIEVIWKYFGYHGGSHVLDQLIYGHATTQRPKSAAEVGRYFETKISTTLAQKACIAVMTLDPEDTRTVRTIFRMYQQLQEPEKRRQKKFPPIDFTPNLKAFKDGLKGAFDAFGPTADEAGDVATRKRATGNAAN